MEKAWKSRSRGRTWSCAPARSRTLSVLNLRPSERYASAAFSSIPISLCRNASRLPSLKRAQPAQKHSCVSQYLSMSQRVAVVCSLGQRLTSVIQEGHTWNASPSSALHIWIMLMSEMRGSGLLGATHCGAVANPPVVVCVPLKRKVA